MAFGLVPWRMVAVVYPTTATILGDSLIYVVLPVSVAEFGLAGAYGLSAGFWAGAALSINRFVRLISNGAAAVTYERVGFRAPLVAATVTGAATTAVYAFSHGIWVLLVARTCWGVSYSFLRLAAYLTAVDAGADGTRARLLGFFNAGQRLGSLIAVTAGAWLAQQSGRTTAFWVMAAAGVTGVAVAFMAPEPRRPAGGRRRASAYAGRASTPGDRVWDALTGRLPRDARAIRGRLISIFAVRGGNAFAANGLVVATVSLYVTGLAADDPDAFGMTVAAVTVSGLLVGSRWFADLALSVPLGHLADRLGRRQMVTVCTLAMAAACLGIALARSMEIAVISLPVLFASSVGAAVATDAEAGDVAPEQARSVVLGRYTSWLDAGAAIGPVTGIPLAEAVGFELTYAGAAVVLLVLLAAYVRAGRRPAAR
jgi:MFS family permease